MNAFVAAALALVQRIKYDRSKAKRSPHQRSFRHRTKRGACPTCRVTMSKIGCKNRMCLDFVGTRESVEKPTDSLDREVRRAAQPRPAPPRPARNCVKMRWTTRRSA